MTTELIIHHEDPVPTKKSEIASQIHSRATVAKPLITKNCAERQKR
jgi:transcriptional regulator with AAA-type ATPase domain